MYSNTADAATFLSKQSKDYMGGHAVLYNDRCAAAAAGITIAAAAAAAAAIPGPHHRVAHHTPKTLAAGVISIQQPALRAAALPGQSGSDMPLSLQSLLCIHRGSYSRALNQD